jgi:glycine/D-amino acid oxidase-like deaminating enzyme
MKTIVVGAGFAGLALSYHLLQRGYLVELYDEKGIGEGASGTSSGLLHPYVGEKVKRSWRANEALAETRALLEAAAIFSRQKVADFSGLTRVATLEQAEALKTYPDVKELSDNLFLIESGITVYSKAYLEGLYQACLAKGLIFKKEKIESLSLEADLSFFALGAGIFSFKESEEMGLRPVRGQVLLCEWPDDLPFLERSILGKGHIVPLSGGDVHLGATYERGSLDVEPKIEEALVDLGKKAKGLIPKWDTITVKEGRAGIRVARPGHYFPVLKRVREKSWAITGMGSRGLLYHAYAAKILVDAAVRGVDPNLVLFKKPPFDYDQH